jgi:hypothetical protein
MIIKKLGRYEQGKSRTFRFAGARVWVPSAYEGASIGFRLDLDTGQFTLHRPADGTPVGEPDQFPVNVEEGNRTVAYNGNIWIEPYAEYVGKDRAGPMVRVGVRDFVLTIKNLDGTPLKTVGLKAKWQREWRLLVEGAVDLPMVIRGLSTYAAGRQREFRFAGARVSVPVAYRGCFDRVQVRPGHRPAHPPPPGRRHPGGETTPA